MTDQLDRHRAYTEAFQTVTRRNEASWPVAGIVLLACLIIAPAVFVIAVLLGAPLL